MEHIPELLKTAAEFGFSPLNLVLLAMLYFMGANQGFFPKFWSSNENDKTTTIQDLHNEMTGLKKYFNHETTDRLDSLNTTLVATKEGVEKLNRKHEEYDKYGIKTRK